MGDFGDFGSLVSYSDVRETDIFEFESEKDIAQISCSVPFPSVRSVVSGLFDGFMPKGLLRSREGQAHSKAVKGSVRGLDGNNYYFDLDLGPLLPCKLVLTSSQSSFHRQSQMLKLNLRKGVSTNNIRNQGSDLSNRVAVELMPTIVRWNTSC
jgi:hypothetical protein